MRQYLLVLLIIGFGGWLKAYGQTETILELAAQPLAVYPVGEQVHVFCNQIDRNFNGVQDEGDLPASWWIIEKDERTVLSSVEFEWGTIGFPFRPGIDRRTAMLYLPLNGNLQRYALDSQQFIDAPLTGENINAVVVDERNDRLILSSRDNDNEVLFFDLQNSAIQRRPAKTNVQQVLPFKTASGKEGIAVLNEGTFGQSDSQLQIISGDLEPEEVVLDIGGTGNHIALDGEDRLLVTMSGSHEIHIVDIEKREIVRSIATRTEGLGGPRESVRFANSILVSTYTDDVRRFDYESGELLSSLKTGSRPEGMAIVDDKLWVANAYETGTYNATNTLAVLPPMMSSEVEDIVPVGRQPVAIFPVNDVVHVLCNQVDENFNGLQDENDTPASWYILNAQSRETIRALEFEWGFMGFPIRPGLDVEQGYLYISHLGRIRQFSLETQKLVNDEVLAIGASAVSVSPDGRQLLMSVRGQENNHVVRYNLETGEEQTRSAYPFVQQTLWFRTSTDQQGYAVLSEGAFGGDASKLQLVYFDDEGSESETVLDIGGTGNHLVLHEDNLYVTMNGSHEIQVIDLLQQFVAGNIKTRTDGFDGPRESVVVGADIFVTSYDGFVRQFDVNTGDLKASFMGGGKPEGLAWVDGRLWVANSYVYNSFSSDFTVAILDVGTISTVDERVIPTVHSQVVPNPARDYAELQVSLPYKDLTELEVVLVSVDGREHVIPVEPIIEGKGLRIPLDLRSSTLPQGLYVVCINTRQAVRSVPLLLIR